MLETAEVAWTAQVGVKMQSPECVLFLDPATGLRDIDFHPVTEERWKNLAASTPSNAAELVAPPSASVDAVKQAIDAITQNGGYATVHVIMRKL